jgi:hypothetical protein
MDTQSLKLEIIHWLTELKDKTILEKIHAIKNEREEMELSRGKKMELDKRLEK